jgi:hypothetical protein
MHFQSTERPDEDTHFVRAGDDYLAGQMANDPLDDVWGADEDAAETPAASVSHPSDMHRLRSEHTNAGYREGVTVAKAKSVQAGFDEGFSLGATIGREAGQLLGTLEGITEAVSTTDDAASVNALLADARAELSKAKLFSPDHWAPDGNWKFDVQPKDGEDVVFSDVAAAHPLIRKWTETVDAQIKRWQIDVSLLDDDSTARLEADAAPVASSAAPTVAKPLDW